MTIDKQKLQKLLWSEVASWKADCSEWKQSSEALGEFLGEKTMEEVALELLAENERLNAENKQLILLECHGGTAEAAINLLSDRDKLRAENEVLRKGADRYRWLQQWYIEGRPRSEIHPDGHICFTTPVIMDLSIDAAMGKGELS
ncbi:hypothetical protein [Pseudomonas costantinii]|uniref:hypothetical protein n=1 Tax=Pseudomonas costantinii TaxID=168469 RepID=UPI00159FFB33|nr:hypothetical protein [Pseudomonas costantinii]NVZ70517.1 hypothetical protein [Pseudomonas costantinii]